MKKIVSGSSLTQYITRMKFKVPTPHLIKRAGMCSLVTPSKTPTLLDLSSKNAKIMLKIDLNKEYSAAVMPCVTIKYCATPLFTVKKA
jgi:hypothetical protein